MLKGRFKDWGSDFRASIVVFLIALPLAMGIAIASGYPPEAGLVTGIIGGLVVGYIGGAPLQVSGAAAGLTVIVFECVQDFGLERTGLIVLIAGLLQILAGFFRFGRWFRAVAPSVIHGMLAGIGILIILSQFLIGLDLTSHATAQENLFAWPKALQLVFVDGNPQQVGAASLLLAMLGVLLLWPKLQWAPAKAVPGSLVGIVIASLAVLAFGLPVNLIKLPEDIFTSLVPKNYDFLSLSQTELLVALEVALIASTESLLCASAVDRMQERFRTRYNKELIAQGVGNTLCGLVGSLPMTGVIVRSAANVNAGAVSRRSTMFHAAWLLIFAAGLPWVLSYIPVAALAGILVMAGWKLIDLKYFKKLWQEDRIECGIFLVTALSIVAFNILAGVAIGLGIAALRLYMSLTYFKAECLPSKKNQPLILKLKGSATFLKQPEFSTALDAVPPREAVKVDLGELYYMDYACSELLHGWKRRYEKSGGAVEIDATQQPPFVKKKVPQRPTDSTPLH